MCVFMCVCVCVCVCQVAKAAAINQALVSLSLQVSSRVKVSMKKYQGMAIDFYSTTLQSNLIATAGAREVSELREY